MKKFIATLAMSITVLTGVLAFAQPAQAAWNACPVNSFCTWENTNYWGVFEYFDVTDVGTCLATRWDVSSVRNRRNDITIMYTNGTCSGTGLQAQANQSFPSMPGQIGDNGLRSIKRL